MIHINENFLKLRAGYLFPEIGRRVRAFREQNPGAKVISMGIGDVTQPLAPAVIEAMHRAVDEMGRPESFKGYDDGGVGYEFRAISATVIGGCAFSGGRGDIVGTVIGVLFMRVLENGILKFGFPTETQQLLTGVVIVLMLIFDAFYNEFMTERSRRRGAMAREMAVIK